MAAQSAFKRIKAARLIDGLGERPVENGAVLVEGSRIRQAGGEGDVAAPEGATVEEYNYPTATLLPGLTDVHCHFTYLGDGTHTDDVMAIPDDILLMRSMVTARTHLEAGVTTARETGGKHSLSFPFLPAYTVDELRALCDEAHNFVKLVGAHCRSTAGIVNSLAAGVDMIIHVWFREADESFNFRQDVAERIAREGRVVNSTLHIGRARAQALAEKRKRTEDPADKLELEETKRGSEIQMEHARRLDELGVSLIPGTDSGFGWFPFGGFSHELEALVDVGFTPMRAIRAATRDASAAIGVSAIVGTLEAGKEADLLVVDGDAVEDINALYNVLAVFQGGIQVR